MPASAFKRAVYPQMWHALQILERIAATSDWGELAPEAEDPCCAERELLRALRQTLQWCEGEDLNHPFPRLLDEHRLRTSQVIALLESHLRVWGEAQLRRCWPGYRLSIMLLLNQVYDYLLAQDAFCSALAVDANQAVRASERRNDL